MPKIIQLGKSMSSSDFLTMGKFRELTADLPDDAPVFIERVEDSYFKKGTGWPEKSVFKPWDDDDSHLNQYVQAFWPRRFKDDEAVYLTPHY